MTGKRVTDRLSTRAVRTIVDAADMAVINGTPLRAFYTFTVAPEHRAAVLDGSMTLGSEMRRFLDHLRKRVGGSFSYVWVAECPVTIKTGEPNPHVHLLTSYTVPRADFADYAAWAESRWGLGFVHMERIRDASAAGRYMLKAVNYIRKGSEPVTDSAPIWGRRWGVSSDLRASEDVEWFELTGQPRTFANVCELFGGGARAYGRGYFTGRGLVYDSGTGVADINSDALRLLRYGTAIVIGTNNETENLNG